MSAIEDVAKPAEREPRHVTARHATKANGRHRYIFYSDGGRAGVWTAEYEVEEEIPLEVWDSLSADESVITIDPSNDYTRVVLFDNKVCLWGSGGCARFGVSMTLEEYRGAIGQDAFRAPKALFAP
jgi:hypothetical protein